MGFDRLGQLRPISEDRWISEPDPVFNSTCPFSPMARNEDQIATQLFPTAPIHSNVGRFIAAYAGHCASGEFRKWGSSGGMVSWTLDELLRLGLIDGVAHVVKKDRNESGRYFGYRISRSAQEIKEGAKSRYYPVEMSEVLREIRSSPGKFAVVGVPCFIKAIQLLRNDDPILRERIRYTIGLVCGHMKSAAFADSISTQMGAEADNVVEVDFRIKDETRPASTYTAEVKLGDGSVRRRDWWNMVDGDWGAGFFQYDACNYCDDVIAETADVSFGDAWVEPYSSDGRGTNIVVVRSPEIYDLMRSAIDRQDIVLTEVDEGFIVSTQAAGFRQRREGLAYRLTWPKHGLRPVKRWAGAIPPLRRRLIYLVRAGITYLSPRFFAASSKLDRPAIYQDWARSALRLYRNLAYSSGWLGRILDSLGLQK